MDRKKEILWYSGPNHFYRVTSRLARPGREAIVLFVSILCLAISFHALGQSIVGRVITEEGTPLNGAVVNILQQRDSIFHSFGRTDLCGNFSIPAPSDTGAYFLVFLYPKHTDVAIPLPVDDQFPGKDLGEIMLPLNAVFIEEVVITARSLMRVKGDTLEYDISGLNLSPNSRVEDVLNQLPGMRITRGGQIFSHGKVVERVLVDGEPFFGNDPALVTRNIRSDIVDKIQVYEDASENEKITGIKDNNKRKTIDIKLKEEKNKGMFGMAQLGYMNGHYNNLIMLNRFNGKEKIFGYAVSSNTGKLGVGYRNTKEGGSGLGEEFDDQTGNFTGEGRPEVYSSGLSYSNDWEKHRLNTHVSVKGMTVNGDREIDQVIDSETRPRKNSSTTNFQRTNHEQHFNLEYEWVGRSKLNVLLSAENERIFDVYQKRSRIEDLGEDGAIRTLRQDNHSQENVFRTDLQINWSKTLKKEGRRIAVGLRPSILSANSDNAIKLYGSGLDSSGTGELLVQGIRHENNLDFNLIYSEPIFGGLLVSSFENKNYLTGNHSKVGNQERSYPGSFGGHFRYNYRVNRVKSVYRATIKGFTTEFGTALSFDRSDLEDITRGSTDRNDFIFLQPAADLEYRWSQNHTLKGGYSKTNIRPTSFLVQSFADAEDLLNVYIGNTALKPRSINRLFLDYYNFKLQKLRAINASLEYNLKRNDIGYSILTGEDQNTIRPVHIDKATYDYTFSTSYGKEVTGQKDYLWLQVDGMQSISYSYVNEIENRLRSAFIKFRPSLAFKERAGIRFNLGAGPVFESLEYSQNEEFNFNGFGFEGEGGLDASFPLALRLEQRFQYTYKPRNELLGTSLNQLLWDLSLIKNFGREDSFAVELSVNDLLDQNQGLKRNFSNTGFTERRYSAIGRYFLLSFKWDLNQMGD